MGNKETETKKTKTETLNRPPVGPMAHGRPGMLTGGEKAKGF
jgi:hypothetical protein